MMILNKFGIFSWSRVCVCTHSRVFNFGQKLDNVWTWTISGHRLDKTPSAQLQLSGWQILDKYWTNVGQIIVQYLSLNIWHWTNLRIRMKSGQTLDKIETNLSKIGQRLDMDKIWTNIGENLDKYWTFVQNLSKYCPNTRSTPVPKRLRLCEDKEEGRTASSTECHFMLL